MKTTAFVSLRALIAFFIGNVWFFLRPEKFVHYFYETRMVALTHVFTLGWVSLMIVGVLRQLGPVAFGLKHRPETGRHAAQRRQTTCAIHLPFIQRLLASARGHTCFKMLRKRSFVRFWISLLACLMLTAQAREPLTIVQSAAPEVLQPPSGPQPPDTVRFVAIGDMGTGSRGQYKIADAQLR
jgi:hypothetical protein